DGTDEEACGFSRMKDNKFVHRLRGFLVFLSANVRECMRIRADGYVLFVTPYMALIRAIRGPKFLSC
ncbi:MAG: hypothetical protein LBT00_05390, partial [Spirochaetaceae bacterium]|nr:hypothetical protein [Spirochaetaceae bacterium]